MEENPKSTMRNQFTPNDYIIEGAICRIGCYNNKSELVGYAIIDTEDVEKCRPYKWHFAAGYVCSSITGGGYIRLQQLILGIKPSRLEVGDHKNRNPWDNRKDNLRHCRQGENNCNKRVYKNNRSGYRGIYWMPHINRYVAQIRKDGQLFHLGTFQDIGLAVIDYNKAATDIHGEFAQLNLLKR